MRFTLTYDGELRANGNSRQKWMIRNELHPQLKELWRIDPSLRRIEAGRYYPKGAVIRFGMHHSVEPPPGEQKPGEHLIDLCERVERGGVKFLPLVRNSFLVKCGLKITFLRKEEPGNLYQGGDIDNRLKTLFDALSVPTKEQVINDNQIGDPIYCLLEDDSLITKIDIETHQLLKPSGNKHDVHLTIEVDVRVIQPRGYNEPFLGG